VARALSLPGAFFCYTRPPPTGICTLSLHDALPISRLTVRFRLVIGAEFDQEPSAAGGQQLDVVRVHPLLLHVGDQDVVHALEGKDRKSTRLNSSHQIISYAVFCLKKKRNARTQSHA